MNTVEHRGIKGTIEFDQQSKMFIGKLIGVNGAVMYEALDAKEFETNFISAVDEYINICESNDFPIKKEFKGVFNVRTTPEIHEKLNLLAIESGTKINTLVNNALILYVESMITNSFSNQFHSRPILKFHRGVYNERDFKQLTTFEDPSSIVGFYKASNREKITK